MLFFLEWSQLGGVVKAGGVIIIIYIIIYQKEYGKGNKDIQKKVD